MKTMKAATRVLRKRILASLTLIAITTLTSYMASDSQNSVEATPSLESSSPNIIFILTDDLDENLTEWLIETGHLPNIKTYIRDAGTNFVNSFVTTAVCCPARATFLTGQYSHNHGVLSNQAPSGGVSKLDDSSTLATWLKDAGYITGHVGRYLNEYGSDSSAPITNPLHPKYIPPGYHYWRAAVGSIVDMYAYYLNEGGRIVKYGSRAQDYKTDVFSRFVAKFIDGVDAQDDRPFLLVIAPTAPHLESPGAVSLPGCDNQEFSRTVRPADRHNDLLSTLALPQPISFNESDLSDKPPTTQNLPALTQADINCLQQQYQDRAESMLAVDDLVGNLFNALARNDELDNTVVFFTSDNGYYHGEHRLFQKLFPYEEGIRVPLMVRAPGYTAQVSERFVVSNDWAPTVAEFAGVIPDLSVDGRSLLPLLEDPQLANWRRRFLIEYQGADLRRPVPQFFGIRSSVDEVGAPDDLYVVWEDEVGSVEYYDLATDPFQVESRHNDPGTQLPRQILQQHLDNLSTCGNGTCQTFEDN